MARTMACSSYLVLALMVLIPQVLSYVVPKKEDPRAIARRVLDTVPLIDGHNDWPMNMRELINNKLSLVDFRQNLTNDPVWGQQNCDTCYTDIPRLQAGKLGAQFWAAFVGCSTQYKDAVEQTMEQIDVVKRVVDLYPDVFEFVTSAQGILDAFSRGKIGSLIGVEGGHSMDSRLAVLRLYYEMGVRYLTMSHSCTTPWIDASPVDKPGEVPTHNGITDYGRVVVHEMNRLGMILDLSHVSKESQIDILVETRAPVMFSHSSVNALCDSHRNVHDDVLTMVRDNNGIVMVNFYTYFVTCSGSATIQDIANHLNHIRRVAGVDHVGIGSDYDGIESVPTGLEDVSKYPDLFEFLAADTNEPWTEEELQKLAGLNLIRVFSDVERVRDEMAAEGITPYEDLIPVEDLGSNTGCMTLPNKSPLLIKQESPADRC